jgi:hypothetical protein
MNDPHVGSLFYRIKHDDGVDYAKAPPLEHCEPGFSIRIENGQAQIDMTHHYATVQDARATVETFLRAWELTTALKVGPGEWQFIYDRANVIDRNPTLGAIEAAAVLESVSVFMTANAHVARARYPDPPAGIARDAAVDLMFERYCMYRDGRTTLPDAANFCLTTLELSAGGRKAASKRYGIAFTVLNTLGRLAADKGGKEARKARATHVDFTSAERNWLILLIPLIIRRVAEVAFDAAALRPQITTADLPPLAER